jgi:hypothetical protein
MFTEEPKFVDHTVEYQYGSYSGTTTIYCDENTENDTIAALVRKQEGLDFLPMYYWSMKIVDTKYYD